MFTCTNYRFLIVFFIPLLTLLANLHDAQAVPRYQSLEEFLIQLRPEPFDAGGREIAILFTPGTSRRVPKSLVALIQELAARGYSVKSQVVDETEFRRVTASSDASGQVLDLTKPTRSRNTLAFVSQLRALLGLSFHRRKLSLDPLKPFRDFNPQERSLFLATTFIHTSLTLLGSGLRGQLNFAAASFLTIYFYQTFANFSEILQFKGQGTSLVRRGETLSIVVNPYFVTLANFFEELAINTAINTTLPQEMGEDLTGIVRTSAIFSLSKSYVDQYAAQIELQKKEARERGQDELLAILSKRQSLVMNLFFNGVIPFARALVTFSRGTTLEPLCRLAEPSILVAVSCLSVFQEISRSFSLLRLPVSFRGEGCARAFVTVKKPRMAPAPRRNRVGQ